MKNPVLILTATLTIVGLMATQATARGHGMDFGTLDADQNGELTLQELQAAGDLRFEAMDTDSDGLLSMEELVRGDSERAERRAARMMDRLDANEDGGLDRAELTSRRDPARMFERLDEDENGAISQAEFEAARDRHKKRDSHRSGE